MEISRASRVVFSCVLVAAAWAVAGRAPVLVGTVQAQAFFHAPAAPPPGARARRLGSASLSSGASREPQALYAGSTACRTCHAAQYAQWHDSLHVQMTKPIAEARIEGDFRPGTHLEAYGRSYRMEKADGHYYISVSVDGRPSTKYEVDYTLGARRFQGYLSKLPDGRIYVLPVFWHRTTGRWIDWSEIAPIPRHYSGDLRQIWNVNCVNCHGVNIAPNYDVASRTFKTTWTEMGIGCEDCHGPGDAHIQLMKAWAAHPESRPALDLSAKNHDLGRELKIFSPRTAEPRQVLDTCGYCHGNKTNYFLGFTPGRLMEDFAEPFLISEPIPPNDSQGEFWPDGRPSRFNRPQAVIDSQCFQKGGATCISCHVAHGSRWNHSLKVNIDVPGHPGEHSRQSDSLCTQCHRRYTGAALEAHTHHPAASQGSRCINCHMADVNWRLFTRRLDHTFEPPVPEMTAGFGEPNACTSCHDDKTPEWAARIMDGWYHNGTKRAAIARMAETLYRAGAGETAVIGDVAAIAVDRTQGPVIRASAATFAGRLIWSLRTGLAGGPPPGTRSGQTQTSFGGARAASPEPRTSDLGQTEVELGPRAPAIGQKGVDSGRGTPDVGPPVSSSVPGVPQWVVNALIGAAADPEPIVRVAAVQALGYTGDPRVIPSLVVHLTDPARLVRVNAAQALLQMQVTRLDGSHQAELSRAQAEWAESLSTFGDVADDHVSLGWLYAQTGRSAEANRELRTGLALDPTNSLAHVYLGVLAARAGRFEQAIKEWQRAQALGNENPAIGRLIAEARKRGGR